MKRTHYFYVLKDPTTKEIRYVGKTINPSTRLYQHTIASKLTKTHKCCWIKSLKGDPIFQVIYKELCTVEESFKIEKMLLKKLGKRYKLTNSPNNLSGAWKMGKLVYQYSLEGDFIKTFENATQASEILSIPDSNILRACKESTVEGCKMAGNYLWLHERYLKYPYPLYKKVGNKKKIIQLDLNNNILAEFESARKASEILGISYKLISRVCTGEREHTYGYKFKFKT